MSLGRPSRMTAEQFKLLEEQAQLWGRIMSLKQLSEATGFSRSYCRDVMEQIRRGVTVKITVSRETNSRDTA